MRLVAALLAIGVLALAGCGGGDSGDGASTATATAPAAGATTASGALLAFFQAAARGDSAEACALLAPRADAGNATASLLIAGTGAATFTTVTDCASTIDAFDKSHPTLLRDALPDIKLTEAGAPEKIDIARSGSPIKYHATLVQVGSEWRILEVLV